MGGFSRTEICIFLLQLMNLCLLLLWVPFVLLVWTSGLSTSWHDSVSATLAVCSLWLSARSTPLLEWKIP